MTPEAEALTLRPCVLWFAQQMEAKLRKHDEHRGARGWTNDEPGDLLWRVHEEAAELEGALIARARGMSEGATAGHYEERVVGEAVDVANMAMMVADVARGCP